MVTLIRIRNVCFSYRKSGVVLFFQDIEWKKSGGTWVFRELCFKKCGYVDVSGIYSKKNKDTWLFRENVEKMELYLSGKYF